MRYELLALVASLALPAAAFACSCVGVDDPSQLRQFAEGAAKGAVALVEVEVVKGYDPATGQGEDVRVIRTLAGKASATFRVMRGRGASGASCDDIRPTGQRRTFILYSVSGSTIERPTYRVSNLCTNLLIDKPAFRDTLVNALASAGERG